MKAGIERFLTLAEEIPVIDVRSPSEYNHSHIPGSVNIPLFDDSQRAAVGTAYKNMGRESAIMEGLKHVGPLLPGKLKSAIEISVNKKLLVHCWRGGMRSEAMAWLFETGGLETLVLEGGYKAYRHYVAEQLSIPKKTIILGGMTGSGKTQILKHIISSGAQVIDLEGLANHKGSAFGALGQSVQPSTEYFSNLLFDKWRCIDENRPVWLEDESRNIGTVFMPEVFYRNMQAAPTILLNMDMKTRLPRLLEEYTLYPVEELTASIKKISKRLGGENTNDAIQALNKGDYSKAIGITLIYYDKAYAHALRKKNDAKIINVYTDTDNIEENASKVLEASLNINW